MVHFSHNLFWQQQFLNAMKGFQCYMATASCHVSMIHLDSKDILQFWTALKFFQCYVHMKVVSKLCWSWLSQSSAPKVVLEMKSTCAHVVTHWTRAFQKFMTCSSSRLDMLTLQFSINSWLKYNGCVSLGMLCSHGMPLYKQAFSVMQAMKHCTRIVQFLLLAPVV